MRPIKFRAWDVENKMMMPALMVEAPASDRQFTYEFTSPVIWWEHGFYIQNGHGGMLMLNGKLSEVIGNIYENPEILK